MKKTFAIILGGMLLSAPALAVTEDGKFALHGAGASRCDAVIAAYKADKSARIIGELGSWVSGYIDAANRAYPDGYDLVPIANHATVAVVGLRVCENNPASNFEEVIWSIIRVYGPLKDRRVAVPVSWKNGDREVSVSSDLILKIQDHLARGKFFETKSGDGTANPKLIAALSKWQKSKKIPETGMPDAFTLFIMAQEISQ